MAIFEIQGPDGKTYEVEAPSMEAAAQAMQSFAIPQGGVSTDSEAVDEFGGKLGAGIAGAVDTASFGLADEATGLLSGLGGIATGEGYMPAYERSRDAVRGEHAQRREAEPLAYGGGGFAGALMPGTGLAGFMSQGASLPAKVGRGILGGAALGGGYGFASGEGGIGERVDSAVPAAIGGGVSGGAIPLAGAGIRGISQGIAQGRALSRASKGAPSSDALRAEGNALYRQVDDAGVQIKPESFNRAQDDIVDYLRTNTGFDELPGPGSLTPNTSRVVDIMSQAGDRMASEPTAALPFKSLDQMRRQAGAAAGNVTNKADQQAGVGVIQQLDDFVQRLGPDDLVGGDVEALQSAIGKAREVWGRMSRSQLVDDAMERSGNYLSGGSSGIRNQFKNILQNKKLSNQFTKAEKAALRSVTHGNALNQLINLAGGGIAQMGTVGGGLAIGGVPGLLAGAGLAAGQRKLSEAVTGKAAERARAAIASGKLRDSDLLKALEGAGEIPEFITNSVLNALTATSRQ